MREGGQVEMRRRNRRRGGAGRSLAVLSGGLAPTAAAVHQAVEGGAPKRCGAGRVAPGLFRNVAENSRSAPKLPINPQKEAQRRAAKIFK